MTDRFAAFVFTLGLCACRPSSHGHVARQEVPQEPSTATELSKEVQSRCAGEKQLPLAQLTIEWQEGEAVRRLQLSPDGGVLAGGRPGGRIQGACLLDEKGRIRFIVDAAGAVMTSARARMGAFRPQNTLRVAGEKVTVTEVLAWDNGQVSAAVDDAGTVYSISRAADAVPMPAHVDGDISRARRAALLLLGARPGFGRL